jgi:hypothetical protein
MNATNPVTEAESLLVIENQFLAAAAFEEYARWDGEVADACFSSLDGTIIRADVEATLAEFDRRVAGFRAQAGEVMEFVDKHRLWAPPGPAQGWRTDG